MEQKTNSFSKRLMLGLATLFGNLFLFAGILSLFLAAINGLFFILKVVSCAEGYAIAGYNLVCLWFGGTAQLFIGLACLEFSHLKEEKDIIRNKEEKLLTEEKPAETLLNK